MGDKRKFSIKDLSQFTGSEQLYRHALNRNVLYTEGIQYLAENAGAYWLLDEIALTQLKRKVAAEPFQVWELIVHQDSSAELVCTDGNEHEVYRKHLTYTDFPAEGIKVYFENNTIVLPLER